MEAMVRNIVRIIFVLELCLSTVRAVTSTTDPAISDTSIVNSYDSFRNYALLCPYNKLCNSPPRKEIQDAEFEPCCETCSCSLECHEIGNCCPDMPSAGKTYPKYPCMDLATLWNGVNASRKMKDFKLWFHVVIGCPNMLSAHENPRCEQPKELQDLIVVSNPANGRVYKNKHCARCNNVENYVSWMLLVQCPEIASFSFETFEERDKYVAEYCSVLPLPPNRRAGDLSRCSLDENIIAECNSTGKWNYFEKEIEKACLHDRVGQNVVFTEDHFLGAQTYANVYCYLCNNPRGKVKEDICIARNYSENLKNNFITFTALLDIPEENTQLRNRHCRVFEIWDRFSRVCRKLICPGTAFPVNGTCRDGLKYSNGYSVTINAEISTVTEEQTVLDEEIVLVIESRFLRSIMPDMHCGKCQSIFLQKSNSSIWLMRLVVYSTKDCSVHDLKTSLHRFAKSGAMNLKIKYKGKYHHMKIRLYFENTELFYPVWNINYVHCLEKTEIINSSILQYCISLRLTAQEFNAMDFQNTQEGMTALSSDHNEDNDHQQVCLESYFQKWEAFSGTESMLTSVDNKLLQLILTSALYIMQMTL